MACFRCFTCSWLIRPLLLTGGSSRVMLLPARLLRPSSAKLSGSQIGSLVRRLLHASELLSPLRLLLTVWCAATGHFYQGKPAAQKLAATGQQPAVPSFASSALWRAHSRFATNKEAFRLRQEAACQIMLRHGRSAKEAASMHARRLEASLKLMPAFRLQRVLLPPVIV